MFAVFTETPPPPRGYFARRRAQRFGAFPAVEEKRAGGALFYVIKSETGSLGRDWALVRDAAGDAAGRILFPRDVIPDPTYMVPCRPQALCDRLLLNAAVRALRMAHLLPARLKIALIDPSGVYAPLAGELLALTDNVYAVTQNAGRYDRLSDGWLANLGILPVVTKDRYYLDSVCAIIAPDGLDGLSVPENALLFSPKEFGGLFADTDCFTLPQPYLSALPPNISPADFGGALYEFCAVKALGNMAPGVLTDGIRRYTLRDLANRLADALSNPLNP
ncbi:MAG: hypothetical protein LBQ48_07100 [Oscillospiraceae bacterium]|jgi:hypothetical protein|nr:hypothetical protein [Oscillospiraceae bacterium]